MLITCRVRRIINRVFCGCCQVFHVVNTIQTTLWRIIE
nr:MAG TPA: hypothetical protein [Caudoviricetes sp.]